MSDAPSWPEPQHAKVVVHQAAMMDYIWAAFIFLAKVGIAMVLAGTLGHLWQVPFLEHLSYWETLLAAIVVRLLLP